MSNKFFSLIINIKPLMLGAFALCTVLFFNPVLSSAGHTEAIRDQRGLTIGYYEYETSGKKIYIRNKHGLRLGYYNQSTNKTHDQRGLIVGQGNHLMGILYDYLRTHK